MDIKEAQEITNNLDKLLSRCSSIVCNINTEIQKFNEVIPTIRANVDKLARIYTDPGKDRFNLHPMEVAALVDCLLHLLLKPSDSGWSRIGENNSDIMTDRNEDGTYTISRRINKLY